MPNATRTATVAIKGLVIKASFNKSKASLTPLIALVRLGNALASPSISVLPLAILENVFAIPKKPNRILSKTAHVPLPAKITVIRPPNTFPSFSIAALCLATPSTALFVLFIGGMRSTSLDATFPITLLIS